MVQGRGHHRLYEAKEGFGVSDGPLSGVRRKDFVVGARVVVLLFCTLCLGAHSFESPTPVDVAARSLTVRHHWQKWWQEPHSNVASGTSTRLPPCVSLARTSRPSRPGASRRICRLFAHPPTASSATSPTFRTTPRGRLSRDDAEALLAQENFLPRHGYRDRVGLGRVAQGIGFESTDRRAAVALTADDPRLTKTYAEFPLSSFDALLDAGLKVLRDVHSNPSVTMVDVGSGLGRIVLYAALTRGGRGGELPDSDQDEGSQASVHDRAWDVHGIEIAPLLHDGALQLARAGVDCNVFADDQLKIRSDDCADAGLHFSGFSLHLGPAEDFADTVLAKADIVFAYSTAFSAKTFSPELGALILDRAWSQLLGDSCRPGCVAITTDRALDPACGWVLKDRIDVENPEVLGSTGYIHILENWKDDTTTGVE